MERLPFEKNYSEQNYEEMYAELNKNLQELKTEKIESDKVEDEEKLLKKE